MPDRGLRNQLVRLAYTRPEVRPHLLPVITATLRTAGLQFKLERSPRVPGAQRFKITDPSATPPERKHNLFVDRYRKWSPRTHKRLKTPVLEERGVTEPGDIAYMDFTGESIHLVIVRDDYRGQGLATKLVREFYRRFTKPGDGVRWGRILNPTSWRLFEKMKEEFPDRVNMGTKFF